MLTACCQYTEEELEADLVLYQGPIGPSVTHKVRPGEKVWDYIPDEYHALDILSVKLNGEELDEQGWREREVGPGDRLTLRPVAGGVAAALIGAGVSLAVGLALKGGEWAINKYAVQPKAKRIEKSGRLGPTYAFDIIENNYDDGEPIPVVMGRHRVGGTVVSQFTRPATSSQDKLYNIVACSEGPISGINAAYINGVSYSSYSGTSFYSRTGTNSQTALPGHNEIVTATAKNNQLVRATPVTLSGSTNADRYRIKVTFTSGLYYLDHSGHAHSSYFSVSLRYRTHAGPGAWSSYVYHDEDIRRREPFSIWIEGDFPSTDTYDVEITRVTNDHDAANRRYCDAYVKEFQEVLFEDLRYVNTAVAAVEEVATEQLTGDPPNLTFDVDGVIVQEMASASTMSAAAHTQNPADLMLGLLYNERWGLAKYIDRRLELTMGGVAGAFTPGETVQSAASDYQFLGTVVSWSSPTLTVDSTQGLPYGALQGVDSGATGNVTALTPRGVNLSAFWSWHQFCADQVVSGRYLVNVDQNSNAGTNTLFVDDTTGFSADDWTIVNRGGAKEEEIQIQTVNAGVSFTTKTNLAYNHTQAEKHDVEHMEERAHFDFVFDGRENGWDALERIGKCGRAWIVRYGSYITVVPLKAETPVQLVTHGNIVDGSFVRSYPETGDRPNALDVIFLNEDLDYRRDVAHHEDPDAYSNSEDLVTGELEMYGVTRPSHAYRECYFRLKRLRYAGDPIKFEMGIEALDMEVGDVFRFQHEISGDGVWGGRVVSSTASTITLDYDVTISGGESIRIRHSDDTQETATITSAAGTYRTLSISPATWTSNPAEDEIYAIGTLGRYRVTAVRMMTDLFFEIEAEEDDEAYYVDDYGTLPTFTESTLPRRDVIPPDVEDLTLSASSSVNSDRTINYIVDVAFTKPESASPYDAEVWIKELSGQLLVQGSDYRIPSSSNGEFSQPHGCCTDGTYLYIADTRNGRIVKLLLADLSFVANLGSAGTGNGQFVNPHDVCTDGTHIWVPDSGNDRIQKLTVAGAFVAKLGTTGAGNDQFNTPMGICHAGSSVFVCDTYNHRLVEVDDALVGAGGGTWTTLGAQGGGADQFERPMGISHSTSMLIVGDTGNDRIVKVDDGLVGSGGGTWTTQAGAGSNAFDKPMYVDTDGTYVWVTDYENHRIQRRAFSDFAYQDEVGTGHDGYLRDEFSYPSGICAYSTEIYITEVGNHQVQSRQYLETRSTGYEFHGRTSDSSYTIGNGLAPGEQYRISVVSRAPGGPGMHPDDGVNDTVTITPYLIPPPDVTGFSATNNGYTISFAWDAISGCPDFLHYEIRAGVTWDMAEVVATTTETRYSSPCLATAYSVTYWIAAKTTTDQYSSNPASDTATQPHSTSPTTWSLNFRT